MRSQKECIELLRGYFQNKAKDYGIVRMALFGSGKLIYYYVAE